MEVDFLITKKEYEELRGMLTQILQRLPPLNNQGKGKILKTKDVKALLNCSDSTLSNYRAKGILNPEKVGGTMYYSLEEINGVFNRNKMSIVA